MRAALDLLGQTPLGRAGGASRCWATCWNSGRKSAELHRELVEADRRQSVDLVFCAGPAMRESLAGPSLRAQGRLCGGLHRARAAGALPRSPTGDVVMVKGSNGSKMAPIVKALERQYARQGTLEDASVQG